MPLQSALQGVTGVLLLALAYPGGAVAAEKIQDRHPAMVAQAKDTTVHTFEERWAPVRGLLYRQQLGHEMLAPPAPPPPLRAPPAMAAAPVPVEATPMRERSVKTVRVTIRKPDRETCLRHGLRTVWSGSNWRCRR
jgi:hypothetical protein